ncbi:hypothetical protein KAH55_10630, partial [bacterium]|nr:hypothetical protein [bacterium]
FYRPEFIDYHCHSEFAYCAADVSLAKNQQIIHEMGLSPLIQTEHAFHLYFDKKTAYGSKWQVQTVDLDNTWQTALPHNRMPEFKQIAKKGRDKGRRFGLELDLRADGSLLLADSDRDGWDVLLGAVHHITDFFPEKTTPEEAANLFLRDTQRLLAHPIDILAHPFRFFRRNNLPVPQYLFPKVAALLAKAGVAAEINFHTNTPDPRFFTECLNRGVKLALGTDAHSLAEVGELWPHYQFLKQLNIPPAKMANILFIPARFQKHKKDKDAD